MKIMTSFTFTFFFLKDILNNIFGCSCFVFFSLRNCSEWGLKLSSFKENLFFNDTIMVIFLLFLELYHPSPYSLPLC